MRTSSEISRHYDRIAWLYDLSDWSHEFLRYRRLRPIVWSYARGRTLDLGCGTGQNIPYYPEGLEVVAADTSAGMLARAHRRSARLGRSVEFHQADATGLIFLDHSFDSVVSTFLFCVLPNEVQPQVLSEVHRVLKPGGRLILMEFTYSQNPFRRFTMRLISPYVRWLYRAGFDRRTPEFLKGGGWTIEEDRFVWKDVIRLIVART